MQFAADWQSAQGRRSITSSDDSIYYFPDFVNLKPVLPNQPIGTVRQYQWTLKTLPWREDMNRVIEQILASGIPYLFTTKTSPFDGSQNPHYRENEAIDQNQMFFCFGIWQFMSSLTSVFLYLEVAMVKSFPLSDLAKFAKIGKWKKSSICFFLLIVLCLLFSIVNDILTYQQPIINSQDLCVWSLCTYENITYDSTWNRPLQSFCS